MNEKVLKTLEFHKIIHELTQLATSPPGKKLCSDLLPTTDLDEIIRAQTETEDALNRIFRKSTPSFSGNQDVGHLVKSLEIGATLSSGELLRAASVLECTGRIKSYGKKERDDEEGDSLTDRFDLLVPLTQLAGEIRRCILEEDTFADDASPGLRRIRKSKISLNDKIHSQLTGMVNGSCRTYLQDAVITLRNNRYCIPVKSEYKKIGRAHV